MVDYFEKQTRNIYILLLNSIFTVLSPSNKQVEPLAKLQLVGVDLSVPVLSLLEGEKRPVSNIELNALADILNVSVDWLLAGLNDLM